ncbi:hypothetical protein HAX54_040277, partial [Datura stramonium]|nr:hypothetical protein [Datura stramonium]
VCETPMKHRFRLILASGHYPELALHLRRIETDDSLIYRRWNIFYPSSFLIIGGSSVVYG